jgi:thiosulfate dehydrogenase [quinone] large subunit
MVHIADARRTAAPLPATDRSNAPPDATTRLTPPYGSADDGSATVLSVTGRAATATRYLLAGIRLALGWIFMWAFLDKLFGLGNSTPSASAWLNGGSPTKGFLGKAAAGPCAARS